MTQHGARCGGRCSTFWRANRHYASLLEEDVSKLRVGVARKNFFDDLDPDVAPCMDAGVGALLRNWCAQVREVEVPVDGFRTIFNAEIYEYHEAMIHEDAGAV